MNLLGRRKWWWLGFSLLLMVIGGISLLVWDLKIGLDFTGGTLLEVSSPHTIDKEAFVKDLEGIGIDHIVAQPVGETGLLIKAGVIDQEKHEKVNALLAAQQLTERRFENVGPTVGRDLTQKAVLAVIVASIAIILYVAYSFRNVPKPASSWRFGVTAVIALVHDVFITVGIFAFLSHYFGYEVDALFITALLTVMGFSVHDTIVVFDRLRENMRLSPISRFEQFEAVANSSLTQTLNRSINTSLTVIIVLLAMALLGGETIRPFIVALLIGITIGTYSSIATATPLLIVWQGFIMRKASSR
jgi:preprotein translocase subunit SecF